MAARIVNLDMEMDNLTAVCTGLGFTREDDCGKRVYVKHVDCLGKDCVCFFLSPSAHTLSLFARSEFVVEEKIISYLNEFSLLISEVKNSPRIRVPRIHISDRFCAGLTFLMANVLSSKKVGVSWRNLN